MIAFKTVLLCYREQNSDKQEGRTCPSCATKQGSWVCLQWVYLFECVPCFRQDRMLIPVLTLMEIFTKERRRNVGRRATEVWFPVGLASWLNC